MSQTRSPIVPMAGGWRAFFTTQDGWVHAIDTQTGAIVWETRLPPPLAGIRGQAAPAGIFVAFGGAWDYLLVGTRDTSNPNYFYALSPLTGAVLDQFPKAGELDAGATLVGKKNEPRLVSLYGYDLDMPPYVQEGFITGKLWKCHSIRLGGEEQQHG